MNYQRIYNQLIERAKDRIPEGYVERHHIIPKCMGGTNEKTNLVALYPEEHFVAHALLLKIHKDTEHRFALAKAVQKMCRGHKGKRARRKLYGWLKREHALAMSESQSGKSNSQYGTMWITCEAGLSKKVLKGTEIEDGWFRGRNGKPTPVRKKMVRAKMRETCIRCQSKIEKISRYRTLCEVCFTKKQTVNSHKQKGYTPMV